MFKYLSILIAIITLLSCSSGKIKENSLPYFDFYLEYELTNKLENALIVKAEPGYSYAIYGENIEANVPLGEIQPVKERAIFQYSDEGKYEVVVKVFLEDGTLLANKSLTWVYDESVNDSPIISFSEKATNDEHVLLLVSGSTTQIASELWIEGDLGPENEPQGSWHEIPSTGIIPMTVSDGDALKSFKVKTRNKAGIESEEINLSLPRKSTPPGVCNATVPASANSRFIRAEIEGAEGDQLMYRVYGDTNNDFQYHSFDGATVIDLELTRGEGEKSITFQIKDLAENFCLKEVKTIIYSSDYNPAYVKVVDEPMWTDDDEVPIELHLDHLPSDMVEVYLYGGIEGSNTETWLDPESISTVKLSSSEGHRWIRAKFRLNGEELTEVWDGIYLKPYVGLQGNSSPYTLLMSNIIELDSATISGCVESYDEISYQEGLPCTPNDVEVTAQYTLTDGSVLTRSIDAP